MAVNVTDVKVTENVTLELNGFISRARDVKPVFLGPIAADLRATEAAIFANAGGVAGVPKWAPLTDATMRKKIRGGARSTRILVERGLLESSLTVPGAAGQILRMVSGDTMEFGTEVQNDRGQQFAHYHQLGTRSMFSRKIMPDVWPEEGTERWANMVADYVVGGRL